MASLLCAADRSSTGFHHRREGLKHTLPVFNGREQVASAYGDTPYSGERYEGFYEKQKLGREGCCQAYHERAGANVVVESANRQIRNERDRKDKEQTKIAAKLREHVWRETEDVAGEHRRPENAR